MAKQVEQLEKEKRELQERLKNQEKKVRFVRRRTPLLWFTKAAWSDAGNIKQRVVCSV